MSSSTYARRKLLRGRLDLMARVAGWSPAFEDVWAHFKHTRAPYFSPYFIDEEITRGGGRFHNELRPEENARARVLLTQSGNSVECPLCFTKGKPLYPVTRLCSHAYCRSCIISCFKHSSAPEVACPGCSVGPFQGVQPLFHAIPTEAHGLIDPELAAAVSINLCAGGRQVAKFIKPAPDSTFAKSEPCPSCGTHAIGTVSILDARVARCPSGKCAKLFCRECCMTAHIGRCKKDLSRGDYIDKTCKSCPSCQRSIQHWRNHGCHHITCVCGSSFCYVCMALYRTNAEGEQVVSHLWKCPIFCDRARCDCLDCDSCKPGAPCPACDGECSVCKQKI